MDSKETKKMVVKIWQKGITVNGVEIQRVRSVDVKNIGPNDPMEVVLHMDADRVDIQYEQ